MRKAETKEDKKGHVVEVDKDVRISGTDFILEKGDKIEVFSKEDKKED